jgi:CRP-like cAMP-binding protein
LREVKIDGEGVTAMDLGVVARLGELRKIGKREMLWRAGSECDRFYILLSGKLSVY